MEINWNKEYLASVSKEDFLRDHKHFKDHADLEKVWQDAQVKKPEVKKAK